jgi:CHAT domain-containing protein
MPSLLQRSTPIAIYFVLTLIGVPMAIGQSPVPPAQEAQILFQKGSTQLEQEQYLPAITTLETLLSLSQTLKDTNLEAQTLQNLAIAYKATGQYLKAMQANKKAGKIFHQQNNRPALGRLLINLGADYQELGDYPKASTSYDQAIAILQAVNDIEGQAIAHSNLGTLQAIAQQYETAQTSYQTSLTLIRSIPEPNRDRNREASALINLGNISITLNQPEKALEYHQTALTIARSTQNKTLQSQALNGIGSIYDNLKQFAKAIPYLQDSLTLAKQAGNKPLQARASNNLGHAYYNTQNYTTAITHLTTAIQILEELRQTIANDRQQILLFDTQTSTYNLLQQVYAAANQSEAALEASEQGRARAFARLLSQRQQSSTTAASIVKISTITIPEIKQLAQQKNATFVQYSLIPADEFRFRGAQNPPSEAILIHVVQPNGTITHRQIHLKSQKQSIEQLITFTRETLGVGNRGFIPKPGQNSIITPRQQLQQLHTLLITPIQDLLPNHPDQPVIFIPQGELFQVPFAALQDSRGHYLISRYTILTAPALQVLQLTQQQRQRQQKPQSNYLQASNPLIVGNPTMPTITLPTHPMPQQLAPLLGSEQEAMQIAQLLNTTPYIGSQARKADLLPKFPSANLIHLATHGLLDDFQDSGIPGAIALAPDGTGKPNDGLLTASEIFTLELNANLVVLSACDTGRGTITGDSVIGLSRSLISAGVPSVIVSLWAVPDAPTADLMVEFYRNLQQKPLNKAQALRQAMLTTLKKYPNPRNWAAFTLIGEAE